MALSQKDRVKSGIAFPVRIVGSSPGWILGAVSTLEAPLLLATNLMLEKFTSVKSCLGSRHIILASDIRDIRQMSDPSNKCSVLQGILFKRNNPIKPHRECGQRCQPVSYSIITKSKTLGNPHNQEEEDGQVRSFKLILVVERQQNHVVLLDPELSVEPNLALLKFFFFLNSFKNIFLVNHIEDIHLPWHARGGQTTTFGSWISPSTMCWVLGIELWLSDLEADFFTC